jgi:hypothetical protein
MRLSRKVDAGSGNNNDYNNNDCYNDSRNCSQFVFSDSNRVQI